MKYKNHKYTEQKIAQLAEDFLAWARKNYEAKKLFYFKEWCVEQHIPAEMLSRLAEKSKVFSEALQQVKDMQEVLVVKIGFSKGHNPAFAIFTLKNVAGWRDKQDVTSDDKPIGGTIIIDGNKISSDSKE